MKIIVYLVILITFTLNAPPPALPNFDISCYFNALLQALNVTPEITDFVNNVNYPETSSGSLFKNALIAFQFGNTSELKLVLNNFYKKIIEEVFLGQPGSCRYQQDAEEFLTSLLNILDRNDVLKSQIYVGITNILADILRVTTDRPTSVLTIPATDGIMPVSNLYESLDLFIKPTILEEWEAEKNIKQVHVISKLSEILIIQLKRSYADTIINPRTFKVDSIPKKITSSITVPFILDLKKYVIDDYSEPTIYTLYATILHRGTGTTGGHYIAYVKDQGTWYYCNDDKIYNVDAHVILKQEGGMELNNNYMLNDMSQNGYLFFYRKAAFTEILENNLMQLRDTLKELNQKLKT